MSVNPIAQRELTYQQRSGSLLGTTRLQRLFRIVYYPALAFVLLIFLSEMGAAQQPGKDISAAQVLHGVVIFALVVAVLMHLYLLLQTLLRAAGSIAREKEAGTWEHLLLTGTDARRLVIGKWWGTLRGLLGGYALLIPLRAGVVVWLGAVFDRTQALDIELVSNFVAPTPLAFLSTFPVIAAFTLGSALMVAAVSVLASVLSRKLVEALALGLVLTALVFVVPFAAVGAMHRILLYDAERSSDLRDIANPFAENLLLTWVDNGMSLTSELVNYQTEYTTTTPQTVAAYYASRKAIVWVLTFSTCIALYGLLTWGTLRVAQVVAVRQ
ncbi:MAG TPA: ABC transporter permease subunit, partial [Oceanobacillus sp.]|nr:ABC transporter permease subunit [Oceanobacillus sp.]